MVSALPLRHTKQCDLTDHKSKRIRKIKSVVAAEL